MEVERSPRRGEFVVLHERSKRLLAADTNDFEIEELRGVPGAYIARAKDPGLSDDELRRRLQNITGSAANVRNVLEDREGHTFIPTGNLSVILASPMPRDKLESWARAKGLGVVSQSKWRPKSVVLTVNSDEQTMAEIVSKLDADPKVEAVEQEVLSEFKREASA